MAEFVQVMSQFMRLCDSYKHCNDCPVRQAGFSCDCDHQGYSKTGAEEIEHIIMAWSEEHLEPVYPTWFEWLEQVNVAGRAYDPEPYYSGDKEVYLRTAAFTPKAFEAIPADIAQKLGIEPKAGGET